MKQTLSFFLFMLAAIFFHSCSEDIDDYPKSNLRAISSFAFEPYHNAENNIVIRHEGVIDHTNKVIKVQLPPDVTLTQLRPKIVLSPWTTVSPGSLEYVDFSNDTINFVVTAESGKQAVYSVVRELNYVYSSAELYSIWFPNITNEEAEPLRFTFPNFSNNVTIAPLIPQGNDLSQLLVNLEVSPGSKGCTITVSEDGLEASYRPFSNPGVVNFTNRVSFRITSQSGTTINYRISATLQN